MTAGREEALRLLLDRWVPTQRWFGGKGQHGHLSLGESIDLSAPSGSDLLLIQLVSTRATSGDVATYQVPLAIRPVETVEIVEPVEPVEPVEGSPGPRPPAGHQVGVLDTDEGPLEVWDGMHDAQFVAAWLRLIATERSAGSSPGPTAHGRRQPDGVPIEADAAARVLSGEQSNTSLIVEGTPPVIVKLFRTLHAGANPDVVIQSALAAKGSHRVPAPAGWMEASWSGPDGSPVSGHLAFASEFLTGTRDAWREACDSLAEGSSFATAAYGLGEATAEVHRTMADAFGIEAASPARRSTIIRLLRQRAAWACTQVPDLAQVADRVAALHDDLDSLADFPALQRVHGDYHLGQVLDAPGRGWVLLDFEGEPLRPISERSEHDLALRDVAGMLRSFDYAGHQPGPESMTPEEARAWGAEWAGQCREAFCSGYAQECGQDPRERPALLVALELDKALYEVVYETRNRPDWVDVPLRAVARLTGS